MKTSEGDLDDGCRTKEVAGPPLPGHPFPLPGVGIARLIGSHQIGYALAASTVSPLMAVGLDFGLIFGMVAVATAVMAVLIYPFTRNHPQTDALRAIQT